MHGLVKRYILGSWFKQKSEGSEKVGVEEFFRLASFSLRSFPSSTHLVKFKMGFQNVKVQVERHESNDKSYFAIRYNAKSVRQVH